jgi:hypothetical protein
VVSRVRASGQSTLVARTVMLGCSLWKRSTSRRIALSGEGPFGMYQNSMVTGGWSGPYPTGAADPCDARSCRPQPAASTTTTSMTTQMPPLRRIGAPMCRPSGPPARVPSPERRRPGMYSLIGTKSDVFEEETR